MMSIESEREPSYHESPTQEEKAVNGKKDFFRMGKMESREFSLAYMGLVRRNLHAILSLPLSRLNYQHVGGSMG